MIPPHSIQYITLFNNNNNNKQQKQYLYLLFDDSNFLNTGDWVMNTESHPLPIKKEFFDYYSASTRRFSKKDTQCGKMKYWDRVAIDGFQLPDGIR